MLSDSQYRLEAVEKYLDSSRKQLESLKHDIEQKRIELQQYVSVIDSRVRIS